MNTKQLTILDAIGSIYKTSKNSKLQLEKYENLQSEICLVSNYFQINEIQGIILSTIIGCSCIDEVTINELIEHYEMETLAFIPHYKHLQVLQDKNILEKNSRNNISRDGYSLKFYLLNFISENEPIPNNLLINQRQNQDFHQFLDDLQVLNDKATRDDDDYHFTLMKFERLLRKYKEYKLVDFANKNLETIDSYVFFNVVADVISSCENNFNTNLQDTVDNFTSNNRDCVQYISKFIEGNTKLTKLNLIDKNNTNFSNQCNIQLSKKAVKMLFEMEGLKIGYGKSKNEKLIYPDMIQKTSLFYNPSELQQLNPIFKSMSNSSFTALQKRMKQNNMPIGLTALFYGEPGTGKTETVYQLAKKFNRPIFKVDISKTKSMYFGESQKIIKKVFTEYENYKEEEKVCPILLFNEADAIIGKRKNAGVSPVADTENAIQNILLEELENFNGILFATTNLVNNIDSAFERRFLFKIKFEAPSQEHASKIWKAKIPSISKKDSEFLASNFKLSGGEMVNIARKCIMEDVVLGQKLTLDKIITFCSNEKWNNENQYSKIGF